MRKTKMTRRLPRESQENVPYGQSLENAPIVRRLSGTLTPNISVQDYKKHLEMKFGIGAADINRPQYSA